MKEKVIIKKMEKKHLKMIKVKANQLDKLNLIMIHLTDLINSKEMLRIKLKVMSIILMEN